MIRHFEEINTTFLNSTYFARFHIQPVLSEGFLVSRTAFPGNLMGRLQDWFGFFEETLTMVELLTLAASHTVLPKGKNKNKTSKLMPASPSINPYDNYFDILHLEPLLFSLFLTYQYYLRSPLVSNFIIFSYIYLPQGCLDLHGLFLWHAPKAPVSPPAPTHTYYWDC